MIPASYEELRDGFQQPTYGWARSASPLYATKHHLDYPLFMPAIDLDELDSLQQKVWVWERWWHWARFRREDT